MIKTDEYGFRFHDCLPPDAKLASIWNFIEITREEFDYYRPKIGMEYLIESQDGSKYYIHEMSKYITDEQLIKYIESSQIYIIKK